MGKQVLLRLDVPTATGTVYPRAVVERALKNYKEPLLIYDRYPADTALLSHLVGTAHLEIEGDALVAHSIFFEGKESWQSVAPAGIGSIHDGVVGSDYQFSYLFVKDERAKTT